MVLEHSEWTSCILRERVLILQPFLQSDYLEFDGLQYIQESSHMSDEDLDGLVTAFVRSFPSAGQKNSWRLLVVTRSSHSEVENSQKKGG